MSSKALVGSASLIRALLETLLVCLLCGLGLILLNLFFPPSFGRSFTELLPGPLCLFWFALRHRMPALFWWQQTFFECLSGLIGCLLFTGLLLLLNLLPHGGIAPVIHWKHTLLEAAVSILELNAIVFVAARIGLYCWLPWDHLQRRRLLWKFTHLHITLLALLGGLLVLTTMLVMFLQAVDVQSIVLSILALTAGVIGVLIVSVPLSLLLSYLIVKHTKPRLQALAAATGALRSGNYTLRIPVDGEDEIAQLQTDFNAMASDIEYTMQDLAQTLHELQTERDTVSRLLRERRELIASVSHELRTPMATLRSYLEITLSRWDDQPPETLQRNLQVMENEVLNLQSLVDDLFSLARAEVGRFSLNCLSVQIGPLVQCIVETHAPLARQNNHLELISDIAANLPMAHVDPSRLEQVLQNLLHNALCHTPPGGIIALVVFSTEKSIRLQINDTGVGIAAQDLEHIWERFYQTEQSTTSNNGAGLGLFLVKAWLEAMNATISVQSTPGEGTCFTLDLPLSASPTFPLTLFSSH